MEIKLDNQPPNCNQNLDNFANKYEVELMGTSQAVRILFFESELPQFDPFVRWFILYLQFDNFDSDNAIVKYDVFGINKGKGHVKFKHGNNIYDLINGLLIKDSEIGKGNDKAITVHLTSFGKYLTDKCFKVDGSELVKNKRLILSGD